MKRNKKVNSSRQSHHPYCKNKSQYVNYCSVFHALFYVKNTGYTVTLAGLTFQPEHILVVHDLEKFLRLLFFSFTIYKIELIKLPTMWFLGGLNEINKIDSSARYLARGKLNLPVHLLTKENCFKLP